MKRGVAMRGEKYKDVELSECSDFKDKSKYIELPYEIGNKTIKFENGEVVITEKPKKWLI